MIGWLLGFIICIYWMLLWEVLIRYLVFVRFFFGKRCEGLSKISELLGRFWILICIEVIDLGLMVIEWWIWVKFVCKFILKVWWVFGFLMKRVFWVMLKMVLWVLRKLRLIISGWWNFLKIWKLCINDILVKEIGRDIMLRL